MKITSYDSQGTVIEVVNSDDFVPDYIKTYDKDKSVLELYRNVAFDCTKDDYFGNLMNKKNAEALFKIDYGNYLESTFSKLIQLDLVEDGVALKTPEFAYNEYEEWKLVEIINFYGHKSRMALESGWNSRNKDCLSESTWLFTLVHYAFKKAQEQMNNVESKVDVYKIALQSVINRYAIALRRMSNYIYSQEIEIQKNILKPFVSRNPFRIEQKDLDIYYTEKFLIKLFNNLFDVNTDRRHESYCLLRLFRSDYSLRSTTNKRQLSSFAVSKKEAPNITYTFEIKEVNNRLTEISISDKEIETILDPLAVGNATTLLQDTFKRIYDGYVSSHYKKKWDSHIGLHRYAVLKPIQSWAYLYYNELSNYNQIKEIEATKEQMCFYMVVYRYVYRTKPDNIIFVNNLLYDFFSMLKINNCQNQIGFFEKIYTINEILNNADPNDIDLMRKIENWKDIDRYKKSIEAIDNLISFLDPILNYTYVNEDIISISSLKDMIKSILSKPLFLGLVCQQKPKQLLKKIGSKCHYDCNIALLLNILGALYKYNLHTLKGPIKLLKSHPSIAYNELVRPYGIENDKNNNKFMTQFEEGPPTYKMSSLLHNQIIEEAKKAKYYK